MPHRNSSLHTGQRGFGVLSRFKRQDFLIGADRERLLFLLLCRVLGFGCEELRREELRLRREELRLRREELLVGRVKTGIY